MIKKTIMSLAAVAVLSISASAAMKITIGSGSASGEFRPMANKICNNLPKLFTCDAVGGGSVKNLLNVESGEVNLGLASLPLALKAEKEGKVKIIRKFDGALGGESMFAFGKKAVIDEFANWTNFKENYFLAQVALPSTVSGGSVAFSEMTSDLDGLEFEHYSSRSDQIAAINSGRANIGFAMQVANPSNQFFKDMIDNGYSIIGVDDFNYALAHPEIANMMPVTVKNLSFSLNWNKAKPKQIDTLVIPIALVAPVGLTGKDAKIANFLEKSVNKIPTSKITPNIGKLTSMVNKTAVYSVEKLKELKAKADSQVKKMTTGSLQ